MLKTLVPHLFCQLTLIVLGVTEGNADSGDVFTDLRVTPETVKLALPECSDQILVSAVNSQGLRVDLTRAATFTLSQPHVAVLSPAGRISPLQEGEATVIVNVAGLTAGIVVNTHGLDSPAPVSFRNEVLPILSKSGCNSGGCHGKAEGQNGFKLSVFGYDPAKDYEAIVRDSRGRRVFPADPEQSLLIQKAMATVPHGGGRRIELGARWHRMLQRWISEGMVLDEESGDPITGINVEPSEITLTSGGMQQLRIVAETRSGIIRSVTAEADFQSNNDAIAVVSRDGLIQSTEVPGEAAVLVRYMGQVAVCRVTLPGPKIDFSRPHENSIVDRLVWDKLQALQIRPSEPTSDATFLRRVYLDTIGTLPTPQEAREFIRDVDPEKRTAIIDALLDRPEYADFWTQRWADLLQVDKDIITPQGSVAMTRWVHQQIRDNVPYDQFARSVLTAQGTTLEHSPAAFFQIQSDPEKSARAISQLFLGVRIECAQCHHHPFERWEQKDYFALAGFFTGIERKPGPNGSLKIVDKVGEDLKHPRTSETIPTAALGMPAAQFSDPRARRNVLADWLTSPHNPMFVQTIVNRMVSHYFGRGLVEPVDDLRATNPASNEPLMRSLAEHLVEVKFDLKAFSRTLLNSQVYQLSSKVNDTNRLDDQNYSHAAVKPIPAEVLLDAISQATGIPERFNGWPEGYRAIQIWDNKLPSAFLETFGRPSRQTVCACERGAEPSMAQALHLMNSETVALKLEDRRNRARALATSGQSPDAIIEDLYLATLTRFPNDEEQQMMIQSLSSAATLQQGIEDILWTLLNTREFVFNH